MQKLNNKITVSLYPYTLRIYFLYLYWICVSVSILERIFLNYKISRNLRNRSITQVFINSSRIAANELNVAHGSKFVWNHVKDSHENSFLTD